MSRIGDLAVRFHALRVARRYGVRRGDPRVAEIVRDARVLVREGAGAREAAELAAVPILRVYGLAGRGARS